MYLTEVHVKKPCHSILFGWYTSNITVSVREYHIKYQHQNVI